MTSARDLTGFIAGLPKAELHVHHVGSASPRIVAELARRHPGVVPTDVEDLRRFFEFRDFAHFIEVYLAVTALVSTPEDIRLLTYEVAREMATEQQIRYAELTCTPFTSVRPDLADAGMPIEAYTEAIEDARVGAERDFGLVLRWIYDIPGEFGVPAADATLGFALDHRIDALVGFGLGGPPGCAACRTRGRPPDPRRSGTPFACWVPNASATARRRPRTPPCSPTWPRRASRWRCAPPPTSRPGRWPRWRSTRCATSWRPG
jgi:hypothetical protein